MIAAVGCSGLRTKGCGKTQSVGLVWWHREAGNIVLLEVNVGYWSQSRNPLEAFVVMRSS
jgi:hypothetical protein